MSFQKEVITKLEKINVQLAINTRILDEHQKRSTQMEERFKPVEDHVIFVNKLAKIVTATAALGASFAGIYGYFFR